MRSVQGLTDLVAEGPGRAWGLIGRSHFSSIDFGVSDEGRKTAPRPSLMKLFNLPSQARAVELRAAQQMFMQFARLIPS
jgi:hypothetical protein